VQRAIRRSYCKLYSSFYVDTDRTSACSNNSAIARVTVKANKFTVVVADVISTTSVKDKAVLIANLLSYAHNVVRQLNSSERETAIEPNAVINNSSISFLIVVSLNAVSIAGAPLLRGLVWESKPAVVAASNVFALVVFAVRTLRTVRLCSLLVV
jgi:hypothetical protein